MVVNKIKKFFKMENQEQNQELENEQVVGEQQEQQEVEQEELSPLEEAEIKLKEKEDAYLRLYAEFDNFRKRSAKEKIELKKVAGKDVIQDFLPVLDDINRAHVNIDASDDLVAVKDGVDLILDKLWKVLSAKGLEEMKVIGEVFNPEFHEAITEIPAPTEEQKGTILDQVESGYKLNDVIIRYPKVVVGK